MNRASPRVEIAADSLNDKVLVWLPGSLCHNASSMTTDVNGRRNFKLAILRIGQLHKHPDEGAFFRAAQKGSAHLHLPIRFYCLGERKAGRPDTSMLPSRAAPGSMVLWDKCCGPSTASLLVPYLRFCLGIQFHCHRAGSLWHGAVSLPG
jgi:hypothetical protein